jgi:hypothetical protein
VVYIQPEVVDKSIIKLRVSNQPQSALDSFDLSTRTGKQNIVLQNIYHIPCAKVKSFVFFNKAGTICILIFTTNFGL